MVRLEFLLFNSLVSRIALNIILNIINLEFGLVLLIDYKID